MKDFKLVCIIQQRIYQVRGKASEDRKGKQQHYQHYGNGDDGCPNLRQFAGTARSN